MNKFTQHIPNFVETETRNVFHFTDLNQLCIKLGKAPDNLVYSDGSILEINQDETWWWCLGRTESRVKGLREWKGPRYLVTRIQSMHGWGLKDYQPEKIGEPFEIRKSVIGWYSSYEDGVIGTLEDGTDFIGHMIT